MNGIGCLVAVFRAGLAAGSLAAGGGEPGAPGRAEIRWLAPERVLWVRGYSYQRPATMDDVLAADRAQGWNTVSFDPASDTYTVEASLWIGGTASWEPTYFQIGRPDHPRETVRVRGDVWVRAPRRNFTRADGRMGLVNCLTLGHPEQPDIQARLEFDCERLHQYGLRVGDRTSELDPRSGGELRVYHGTITAARPDGEYRMAPWDLNASYVQFLGATVSWMGPGAPRGVEAAQYVIAGCRFEQCGTLLSGGTQKVRDCLFESMFDVPIRTPHKVEYVRCAFRDNARNWDLQNLVGNVVELIDCDIQPSRMPVVLRRNRYPRSTLRNFGSLEYPLCIERKSCVVTVLDAEGKPVPGVLVSLSCPGDPHAGHALFAAVRNPTAVTGPDGKTPARYEDGALLPAVRRLQATDDPNAPREDALSYELMVEAPGRPGLVRPLAVSEIGTVTIQYPPGGRQP